MGAKERQDPCQLYPLWHLWAFGHDAGSGRLLPIVEQEVAWRYAEWFVVSRVSVHAQDAENGYLFLGLLDHKLALGWWLWFATRQFLLAQGLAPRGRGVQMFSIVI